MRRRRAVQVLVGLVLLPIYVAVAVNAATNTPFPGILHLVQLYPWQALLLGIAGTGVYVLWEVRSQPAGQTDLSDAEQARQRARLLAETRRTWVDGVLARSLGEVIRIELGVLSQPFKAGNPSRVLLRAHGIDDTFTPGLPPVDVFRRSGEQLVILGEPGAGKTTMLLEVARDLGARAEEDPAAHVPVVFNLSSWPSNNRTSFEQWLIDQLRRFYRLPEAKAQYVVKHDLAALLLDGLDEVPAGQVGRCAKAINAFRRLRPDVPIAITCRAIDYERQAEPHLKLAETVVIQPLSPVEADDWLKSIGPATKGLREALAKDGSLRDLLRTPLTLSIAALAYRDQDVVAFTGLGNLFEAYTRTMLRRPRAPLAEATTYDEADVRRWLSTLAHGMTATDTGVLSPDLPAKLRVPWFDRTAIPVPKIRRILLAAGSFSLGLLAGIVALLLGPWQAALAVAVATAAAAWSPGGGQDQDFRRGKTPVVLFAVLASVNLLLASPLTRSLLGWHGLWLVAGISIALVLFVLSTLLAGIMTTWAGALAWSCAFRFHSAASRWESVLGRRGAAAVLGLAAGAAAGGTGALIADILVTSVTNAIRDSPESVWVAFGGVAATLLIGLACALILAAQYKIGDAYAPRLTYRFLASAGSLPPRFARFLAWADDRNLLRKSGEGYIFVHRLYQDWCAAQAPSTPHPDSPATAALTGR